MEIRGVSTNLIKDYPKNEELTEKKIKTSFLNKWKNIGITYAAINSFLCNVAYGSFEDVSVSSITTNMAGGVAVPYYVLRIFGKEISVNRTMKSIIEGTMSISNYICGGILAVVVAYFVISLVYCGLNNEKMKVHKKIKIITLVGIISFLIFLVFYYINSNITSKY